MNRKGFSLIELLIVIAIIAILTGIAVPYYNDYIIDSRTAVLQNNLATIRKAINQFRGDNQRGPIRVEVNSGSNVVIDGTNPFDELVNGPLQFIAGAWRRRTNVKYLERMPQLIDPETGLEIDVSTLILATGNCFFDDADHNGKFNIDDEPAYIDSMGDGKYYNFFMNPFNHKTWTGVATKSLDFIDINLPTGN